MHIDRDEAIKQIRANLKRRSGKVWSVTGDRGTAWAWIKVDVPPKQRTWHFDQTSVKNGEAPVPPVPGALYRGAVCCTPDHYIEEGKITSYENDSFAREAVGRGGQVYFMWEYEDPSKEFGHMSPAARKELKELFGELSNVHHQGLSVSPEAREYYVQRSAGVMDNEKPYRDYD
jgi:hypothetical protein